MDPRSARWERERSWREALALAEDELRLLEAELAALEAEVARIRAVRDSLRQLIPEQTSWRVLRDQRLEPAPARIYQMVRGSSLSASDYWSRQFWGPDGPTTAQAVVECLRLAGQPMRPRDVLNELEARGWSPDSTDPARLVSGTLSRLSANRKCPVERLAPGFYQYLDR